MLSDNEPIKLCILEFKGWLVFHRSELNSIFRKYGAVKYYLITMSIGITIFLGNSLINENEGQTWKGIIIILLGIITLLSPRIALRLSGAEKLATLPAVEYEVKSHWFKEINSVVGSKSLLLNDFYVTKAINSSKKKRLDLFYFLKSMVLIADVVIDERNEERSQPCKEFPPIPRITVAE